MTHRTAHRSMLKDSYGAEEERAAEGTVAATASRKVTARVALQTTTNSTTVNSSTSSGGLPLQFATTVAVGKARLSFGTQRCLNVSKKARGKSAQVWWKGSSSKAKGFSCWQVKFFDLGGCQGNVIDSMANLSSTAAAEFPSTMKTLSKWASMASMLCTDAACEALGCEPGGTCVLDETGERYCKWDSPCGACPTGATCKTVPSTQDSSVQVPYCACPDGYGMTPTKCVKGEASTVASISYTLIANLTARDNSSRPYTFRPSLNNCTQVPAAVDSTFTAMYTVYNIGNASNWSTVKIFTGYNCDGTVMLGSDSSYTPSLVALFYRKVTPGLLHSVMCAA
ncbi:unnamed protein product [Closterium sp. Yama58-4]|nr:unnamed protein product [Closterium sp. Yama58-4]